MHEYKHLGLVTEFRYCVKVEKLLCSDISLIDLTIILKGRISLLPPRVPKLSGSLD